MRCVRNLTCLKEAFRRCSTTSSRQLSNEARGVIDSMLRIDQAGEVAAVRIAASQLWWMSPLDDGVPIVKEILDEELVHRAKMNELVEKHRVRSTVLDPAFHVGAVAMGLGTALLGHSAMMCCHAAVEDVISEHYNDQLRELVEIRISCQSQAEPSSVTAKVLEPQKSTNGSDAHEEPMAEQAKPTTLNHNSAPDANDQAATKLNSADNDEAQPSSDDLALQELQSVVAKFRDDELHHKELGEKNGAANAPLYPVLYNGIRWACMLGVHLARRF
jgi:demethoxyubiquinone hydroxylase (CLK1/Coq7/Cat5 family)